MSDLQCPARVFLARHGEAAYETELLMDHGGTPDGERTGAGARAGGEAAGEKIAHVYSSTISRAVQTAELAAAVLGVAVTVREGLVELALGEALGRAGRDRHLRPRDAGLGGGRRRGRAPGSESAVEIAARVRPVLDDIADQHRGEAVLVVSHGGAIVATQAVLAFAPGRTWDLPNCAYVELEGDADGWRALG